MQTFFDGILASISRFDLIDALDILLVAVMIYYLLKLAQPQQGDAGVKGHWVGFHCIAVDGTVPAPGRHLDFQLFDQRGRVGADRALSAGNTPWIRADRTGQVFGFPPER